MCNIASYSSFLLYLCSYIKIDLYTVATYVIDIIILGKADIYIYIYIYILVLFQY